MLERRERSNPPDKQYLCIYKDSQTTIVPDKSLDWIFESNVDYPLIVITIIRAKDLNRVNSTIEELQRINRFYFDIFKTLGYGDEVIVFRCKTYAHALDCLVQMGDITYNTYSIAGIQNVFDTIPSRKGENFRIFGNLVGKDSTMDSSYNACVNISYMLKDSNLRTNRLDAALDAIQLLRKNFIKALKISRSAITIQQYFEIGHYDIEIRLEGRIDHVLELLLNLRYGLINGESDFYKNFVFDSKTTWKILANLKPEDS